MKGLWAIAVVGILAASQVQAQTWSASSELLPNAAPSCPKTSSVYEFTVSGAEVSVKTPQAGVQRGSVAGDGSVRVVFAGPSVAGQMTISGNARTREMQVTASGFAGCVWALKAADGASYASSPAVTLQACEQKLEYRIQPPGSAAPAKLRPFSGVWLGNLGMMCAAVIFERVDNPDAVQVMRANGRWPAANIPTPASSGRDVGKFDGNSKVTFSNERFTTEYILVNAQELTIKSGGSFSTLNGTLKRQ